MNYLIVITIFIILITTNDCANILGIMPTPARSHSRGLEVILIELNARGHDVTYITAVDPQWTEPMNKTGVGKLNTILLEGGEEMLKDLPLVIGPNRSPYSEQLGLWLLAPGLCKKQYETKEFKNFINNKNQKFDIVISEIFTTDCLHILARHFDAPLVGYISSWPPPWVYNMLGATYQAAVVPNFFLSYAAPMAFLERLHNFVFSAFSLFLRHHCLLPKQDRVVRSVFGEDTPSITEIESDMTMVFSNTHPLFNFPVPMLPTLIEIGGIHVKPAKPLPKDIKEYLDNAKEGVIIFSLGSLINIENLPLERLNLLTETMSALPYKILWRWDTTDVPNLPSNVRVEKWMPQRDILAHPNIKLLVTHGGLLSAQEATIEGIPRVILPFFGDQNMNAMKAVQQGVGLSLNFYKINSQQLINGIIEMTTNQSYTDNSKLIAKAYKDRPEDAIDKAVFWTEYVIRNKGAKLLESDGKQLHWYQRFMIDIYLVLFIFTVLVFAMFYVIIKLIWSLKKSITKTKRD